MIECSRERERERESGIKLITNSQTDCDYYYAQHTVHTQLTVHSVVSSVLIITAHPPVVVVVYCVSCFLFELMDLCMHIYVEKSKMIYT